MSSPSPFPAPWFPLVDLRFDLYELSAVFWAREGARLFLTPEPYFGEPEDDDAGDWLPWYHRVRDPSYPWRMIVLPAAAWEGAYASDYSRWAAWARRKGVRLTFGQVAALFPDGTPQSAVRFRTLLHGDIDDLPPFPAPWGPLR